jgi:ElaB/YqjD/DUF883 family membrane-anchored ribosome-binding protein
MKREFQMTTPDESNASSESPEAAVSKTATAVKGGIDSANDALDAAASRAASRVDSVRATVAPALKDGIDRAQALVQQGSTFVSDTTLLARVRASELTDQVIVYTREKPIAALLIAAATGAVLLSVIRPATRRRR